MQVYGLDSCRYKMLLKTSKEKHNTTSKRNPKKRDLQGGVVVTGLVVVSVEVVGTLGLAFAGVI